MKGKYKKKRENAILNSQQSQEKKEPIDYVVEDYVAIPKEDSSIVKRLLNKFFKSSYN